MRKAWIVPGLLLFGAAGRWTALFANMNMGSSRSKSLLLGLTLAVSLLTSCNVPIGRAFRRYQPLSEEPDRAEIVGTWVPDPATVEDMGGRGGYDVTVPTSLILRVDGTFEMVNMPDWWNSGVGRSYKGFSSTSGRWDLRHDRGHWSVGLTYFGGTGSVNLVEHRFRDKPRYYIEFILGDPDSGEAMIFVPKEELDA